MYLWWRAWVECGLWYNHTVATAPPETSAPHPSSQKPLEGWWGRNQWSIRDAKKKKFIQFAFQVRTVFRTQWSYLHTEGLHSCRHLFTDSSKPCNPKNLSIQLCAHELQNHSQSTQSSNTRMRSNTFSDHNRLVMTGLTQKGKYGYGITTLLHFVLYIMNSCRIPGRFT